MASSLSRVRKLLSPKALGAHRQTEGTLCPKSLSVCRSEEKRRRRAGGSGAQIEISVCVHVWKMGGMRRVPLARAVCLFFLETNLGFCACLGFKNVEAVQPKLHSHFPRDLSCLHLHGTLQWPFSRSNSTGFSCCFCQIMLWVATFSKRNRFRQELSFDQVKFCCSCESSAAW
jgi:hypothetical protein